MTNATTEKPVWPESIRRLYRAAMYWGLGKRTAWALCQDVHGWTTPQDVAQAVRLVSTDAYSGINKPFVNGAAIVLAARQQVPKLIELSPVDMAILTEGDPQERAVELLQLFEELHDYGLRRKRSGGGWEFYIKGGQA